MSHDQISHLIGMLNQIAANNAFQGDTEAAAEKVASHVQRFWARPMKQRILQYGQEDGSALSELAKMALARVSAPKAMV